jgi:excisionase family DNA binding protein
MKESVLTTTQTAKLLGISVRTAQLLIESGGLPSWKTPGGHRRVYRADVEALIENANQGGLAPSATVLVVTTEARLPLFERLFESIPHVTPRFLTDTWSAAVSVGFRAPAVTVIDLDGWKTCGASLMQIIATDSRLKRTALVGVADVAHSGFEDLPSEVRPSTTKTLARVVTELTSDSRPQLDQVVHGDFPIAPNEASRLQAVRRSGLVQSPAEAQFDRLTWLAAAGLKAPIALMTILTGELQWFKSRQGLDMVETPRSWAFCNYTVLQKEVFEVPDLTQHATFSSNPAVANAPHLRFYAGAPIYDPDGFALGSLCVMDFRPRHLSQHQRRTLFELAAIASDQVKLRELLAKPSSRDVTAG